MSTLALWNADKTVALTGQCRHLHKGTLVAPAFTAPTPVPHIQFGPTALAASIARTATLRNAPPQLLAHIRDSALSEAQILLADGPGFELSSLLSELADSERTHFASRVGAGITDLYMNALGYGWRDNAACLSSSLQPHADFLYHGGNALGHGVVLAEARGSFAAKVTDAKMAGEAQRKYLRQVRPFIGIPSPHGQVIHGYSIAFGALPSTPGAFLRLSQTLRTKAKPGTPAPPVPPTAPSAQVPATMALATHRSNFILMDALPVAEWIDWLGRGRDIPEDAEPLTFLRFDYAGRSFLASANALAPYRSPYLWYDAFHDHPLWDDPLWRHRWHRRWASGQPPFYSFVIEEKAGIAFLDALTGMIRFGPRSLPEALDLPASDIVGFASGDAEIGYRSVREDYDYALFRDGLALLATPPRKLTGIRTWYPKEGLK
jgi:hypothetical protein